MQVSKILLKVSLFQYAFLWSTATEIHHLQKVWEGSCLLEWAGAVLQGNRCCKRSREGIKPLCSAPSWERSPISAIWQPQESEHLHGSSCWLNGSHGGCPQAQLQWSVTLREKAISIHTQQRSCPQIRGEHRARKMGMVWWAPQGKGIFLTYPKLPFHVMPCDFKDIAIRHCHCSKKRFIKRFDDLFEIIFSEGKKYLLFIILQNTL